MLVKYAAETCDGLRYIRVPGACMTSTLCVTQGRGTAATGMKPFVRIRLVGLDGPVRA